VVLVTFATSEEPILSSRPKALVAVAGASALVFGGVLPAQAGPGATSGSTGDRAGQSSRLVPITSDLTGPRGLAVINKRKVIVGQADGTISRVVRRNGTVRVVDFAHVPNTGFAPAVARGLRGTVWIVTGGAGPEGPTPPGSATLYKWRPHHGAPKAFADIGAYQLTDPDPYALPGDDAPTASNPFGVAALPDGTVLVADAAGNDLLRVKKNHRIQTVARLKPRMVAVPAPGFGPDGPPVGSMIPAEAVATSVTVQDDAWFVGELRGFPATPGTSQIWKIKPGSKNAVCDPDHPRQGHCKRFVDGLTSIVDLAPAPREGRIFALELSKMSWLALEAEPPVAGAEIGGLFKVRKGHIIRELAKGKLVSPGGVDFRRGGLFVTGPVFGPGKLFQIR
jgi:hypothetical protein